MNRLDCSSTAAYSFINCHWTSCSVPGDAGAAIKCASSNSLLTVTGCSFSFCTAPHQGGAIHTFGLHTLDVKESFFYRCSTNTISDNQGSGAVWINTIQQRLCVSENSFISCTSKASGGAFILWKCHANIKGAEVINNCRYIDCNATDETPDGGAVWICNNSQLIGFTNCFFSLCNALTGYGGSFRHEGSAYQPQSFPIRYCFFNNNRGTYGNDVYLNFSPSDPPLLHCFSTTDTNRFTFWDVTSNRLCNPENQNDWLPLDYLQHLNTSMFISVQSLSVSFFTFIPH